ncbi:MAG: type II toxin-antitoxin system HipA family toxin [Proteobacteria bacterium]|nr:type II toxin-antitoxin system HipA family toxin [Pseudomonadota bacterium]MBU4470987.1 type II toxin-antitoxin system HipA family toxin [Pseudomonadota bacterium]MCG2753587.1 type II toxin-antitoxin system HipA family toxin [Desulfobacteraceae bacterium]
MPKKKITVFIYPPGETVALPAGIFTHERDPGIGTFAYGRKYAERKNALPVDPVALPLERASGEVLINAGLFGAFRDAAPDYWGRIVIAAELKVPPEALSEIDFLLAANATRVGNLDFRTTPDDSEPFLAPPHFNRMEELLEAAIRIEAGELVSNDLLHLLRQGTSIGGARPKCTVLWQDTLWVAKFPSKNDTLNIPGIEYATMTLAGKCGIRVPDMSLQSIGNKDVLLVRRFDREKANKGWIRKGFLSSLSLMQWDENDRVSWDYGAIADTMRRHTSVEDIKEFFRRMVFNILVRNTDDHPRNHGFVFDQNGVRLSPAYDIVPSISRPGVSTAFYLAMSVGTHGREATLENALSRSGRFGLSEEEARLVIERMVQQVHEWQEHFLSMGCSNADIKALEPSFASNFSV